MESGIILNRRVLIVAVTLLLMAGPWTRAGSYAEDYLDSLVYSSTQVVEGRVILDYPYFEVTAVYAGSLSPGQRMIVNGVNAYVKGWGYDSGSKPIGIGDHVFVFLGPDRGGPSPLYHHDQTPRYSITYLGLMWVYHSRVYSFSSMRNNWAPYMLPSASGGPLISDFRAALRASISRVQDFRSRMAMPLDRSQIPWLISVLKDRYRPGFYDPFWRSDFIAFAAFSRLKDFHDLAIVDQVLETSPFFRWGAFDVFSTPQGRDFLLTRIADAGASIEHRRALAGIMANTGAAYRPNNNGGTTRTSDGNDPPDPGNSSYLTRIARLAASDGMAPAVADELILSIRRMSDTGGMSRAPEIQKDLDHAVEVLGEFYRRPGTAEQTRFRTEQAAFAAAGGAYDSLHSSGGPIISMITPQPANLGYVESPGTILIHTEVTCVRPPLSASFQIVLQSVDSPTEEFLITNGTAAWSQLSIGDAAGIQSLALPVDLKPGRYRCFYRFKDNNDIISEGHGCVLSFSQADLSPPARPKRPWLPLGWKPRAGWLAVRLGAAAVIFLLVRHLFRSHRRLRRFRSGRCIRCDYDLRATADRCPECGVTPPTSLVVAKLRRRSCYALSAASLLICLAAAGEWVRSYYVSDCITYTSGPRADTAYSTMGRLVFERPSLQQEVGWSYERDEPAEMVQSARDAGVVADWNILGAQRAAAIGIMVIPMWQIVLISLLIGYAFWRLSRAVRSTISAGSVQSLPDAKLV
ncbi:MAG TPA: hypothetical protein VH370_09595 [Humisphaera sp.]|jgi:hypothetical protein|nr:hypothetical protein [Humisphaera sp.]